MHNPPLHEFHLDLAEILLKVKFPALYRQVLLGERKIHPESIWDIIPEVKPIYYRNDPDEIEDELALYNHLVKVNKRSRGWEYFPEDAFAIAEDGCGNLLVLLVSKIENDSTVEFHNEFYGFDHSGGEDCLFHEPVEEL